jgi:tRNA threonylcarbamoyladenosine biosynthesis protein TsaB
MRIEGPVLALDSSTSLGSVAVGDARGVYGEVTRNVAGGHSSALLPAVQQVMEAAGLTPRELAAVVVGGGPGSFTGLRVAAATAKGMIQALHIPLLAYSGLLATAASAWAAPGPVCALFDARRRDVYAACYTFRERGTGSGEEGTEAAGARPASPFPTTIFPPTALAIDEVVERFRAGEAPLFVGEGALLHREVLEGELGAAVGPAQLAAPRASALIWLAVHAPELGRVDDPTAWEPEYVRASGAERVAARAAAGGEAG